MHIELRNPDPCVNSYLAFAGIIAAGLEGIKKGLMPQAATELNIYRLSEEECEKLNLKRLPKSLSEAVEEMENDPLDYEDAWRVYFRQICSCKKA